jgi:hypothetical protein
MGVRAWEHSGRKVAVAQRKARATGAKAMGARGRRQGEWGQPYPGSLYLYRGPPNLSVAAPCPIQHAPMAL